MSGTEHFIRLGYEIGAGSWRSLEKEAPLDKFIVHQNITHYTQQLMTEADETKRAALQKLLAEEMVKQASLGLPKKT